MVYMIFHTLKLRGRFKQCMVNSSLSPLDFVPRPTAAGKLILFPLQLSYAGRGELACPATGVGLIHKAECKAILDDAFAS